MMILPIKASKTQQLKPFFADKHLVEVEVHPEAAASRDSATFSSPDQSESQRLARRSLLRASKDRPRKNRVKRLTISSSNSTLNSGSRCSVRGSSDTLKAAGSISEFSQHSGDPELEFDLYDCDLNNASAVPGSYFAAGYSSWGDCDYDVTPTGEEEEFELTDLFPGG